ncbi:MAG: DUF2285 domain-containing protein [Caulobacter sp.]|nr:DUF2285 domain-containing protein [Caulobacter sp.]
MTTPWSPSADPSILLFAPVPPGAGLTPGSISPLPAPTRREQAPDADHLVFGAGAEAHIARLIGPVAADQAVAAIVPLDAGATGRLAALERFTRWRGGAGNPARLTAQKRRRIGLMLRAVDARAAGASHRQLAQALFGTGRVAEDTWKTSSLRDTSLRLARDGAALVADGYRRLLTL